MIKIERHDLTTRCDAGGCGRRAAFVAGDGRRRGIYLCEECLKSLYREAAAIFTPKAPEHFVDRAQKNAEYRKYGGNGRYNQ